MDLERRIEKAKKESFGRNCLGTAFFISSVFSRDGYFNIDSAYNKVLKYLVQLRRANIGSLIVLHKLDGKNGLNVAFHAGVITSLRPIRITHRDGLNGKLTAECPKYAKI